MTKKILIEDVDKYYGDKRVLDNIDLAVSTGEFCTLVGPSGCGKSTLLRLILGQEQATNGKILIEGEQVGFPDKNRGIVFQKYSLFPHLTVLQNVLLSQHLQAGFFLAPWRTNAAQQEEAMHYIKQVRLEDAAHKFPHELSGGMRQRAAIAQVLMSKPPVLLMDEPFGALDPDTREDLQLFIVEFWEKLNLTIFFVTHDLEEACFLGSRLLVLSQYYSDDRGDQPSANRGGKIVFDYALPRQQGSTEIKDKQSFRELIADVRARGFDPTVRQHVREFNLTHPDSFQTLTETEYNHNGE